MPHGELSQSRHFFGCRDTEMSTAPHWLASVFFSFSFCSSSLLVAKLWFLVIVHGIKKKDSTANKAGLATVARLLRLIRDGETVRCLFVLT